MTIGIWGDSITFGSCDQECLGWAGRLRSTLPINDNFQLYNFGICGETTQDLLKRFAIEASAIEPNKIILAIGINDSKLPHGSSDNCVGIDIFETNLRLLIDIAKTHTSDITLVGLTQVDSNWESSRGSRFINEEIDKYDRQVRVIAENYGLLYIKMRDVLSTTSDLADGLHPNSTGYQKMFKAIVKNIAL